MTRLKRHSEKEKDLEKHMHQLHIFEHDIKEIFSRSSGPGGQNVNKVATCVSLRHVPTGIQVKCQEARTQGLNRHRARWLLIDRIEKRIKELHVKEIQLRRNAKLKKSKRPQLLKEEILKQKHYQSEKKAIRRKIKPSEALEEV